MVVALAIIIAGLIPSAEWAPEKVLPEAPSREDSARQDPVVEAE